MKEKFAFLKVFVMKKKFLVGSITGVVLILAGIFIFSGGDTTSQTITISRSDFINQVSVSGNVVASQDVDLGFKNNGLVDHVYFSVGQLVKKGQILASLNSADAKGSLEIAKANYQKVLNGSTSAEIDIAKAQVEVAQVSLNQIKTQQEILVKNAKKNLLNSGFIVTTEDQLSNQVPPVVSGTYLKENEGKIIITLYNSSGGTSFQTSGLIDTTGMVSTEVPQPIGNTGLFIKFSSTVGRTEWIINIPNKESANYLENYNNYQSALSNQMQAIANAEAELFLAQKNLIQKQTSSRPEEISSAYGSLSIAEGAYNDKFIFAPFGGMVTKMDAKVGEIVSSDTPLVTIMSADIFQIESYVPEVNIAQIKLGDNASITLDAYGEKVLFSAQVISIDPAETIKDGVSTYKIKLQFSQKDDRIKPGMTANVSITTFDKPDVIVVPGGAVFEKNGKKFIQVKNENEILDKEIITGDTSSLGQVEVISGITSGEEVILNPKLE